MDYEFQVNEVEQQLKESGQQLSCPPSSIKHLLELLDKIEQLLTCVGQAPSISMQGALVPSMGALIGDELIKHSDINVKVSVASCLSEITRITAPEQPYKDEIMKEIFRLNVTAFGELSNMSVVHSYRKAVHVLESVAKVKSFLLMLDLECDDLVVTMFEQFLSKIRSTHSHKVYSDMEYIMTLVINESDEISNDLLSLLVLHVKKENQNVSPVSWKLTEKVLMNCVDTLKYYSETITKLVKSDPDSYTEVATLLCQNANGNEHVVKKIKKRRISSLVNMGTRKNQKNIEKDRLNRKELETPKTSRSKNKQNNSYKNNNPNLVQRRTRLQDKRKGIKNFTGKHEKQLTLTDDEISSDYDGVQNKRDYSIIKRAANGSGGKEKPKKWKQDLVRCRIKVWWPLDKMYYKGVVSSYDRITDRYKVLYVDGDEEILDLYHEKWRMLDETSLDLTNNPTPVDSSKTMKVGNTSVFCGVDDPKDDSVYIESTENITEKVEKYGNPKPSVELRDDNPKNDSVVVQDGEPNMSANANVSCNVDNCKDEEDVEQNPSEPTRLE